MADPIVKLKFHPATKLIVLQPYVYKVVDATVGNDYVVVGEDPTFDSIDDVVNLVNQGGAWVNLASSGIDLFGTKDLSSGYDFSADPRAFKITLWDRTVSRVIYLEQAFSDAYEIADFLNQQIATFEYTSDWWEAYVLDGKYVCVRQKAPYWGPMFSGFIEPYIDAEYGDALEILGWIEGSYVGGWDDYQVTSVDTVNKILKLDRALTETYPSNVYCAVYPRYVQVQDIYDQVMDWLDSEEGIAIEVIMEGAGYFPMGPSLYSDKIFVLKNGWKIEPFAGNYELIFDGTLITDDNTPRFVRPLVGVIQIVVTMGTYGIIATATDTSKVLKELRKHDGKMTAFKFL